MDEESALYDQDESTEVNRLLEKYLLKEWVSETLSLSDDVVTVTEDVDDKSNYSVGTPKRLITSRLTGAGSLLSPVYSEAWAKGNAKVCIPRIPFSSLRDVAHGKHVGRKTKGVSKKSKK
ncbi:hypothetical protein TNCV_2676801 [Trichonephila clavipes]|nr:hypothetical protein TNCV_2676801 [Trichonephila clavipes]